MSKNITISLSDADYAALQSVSAQTQQSPEELIAVAITSMTRPPNAETRPPMTLEEAQQAKERVLGVMRARGHLVDPSTLPPYPGVSSLPPAGSPERARLEEELAEELGEAFEKSGKTILELIDR